MFSVYLSLDEKLWKYDLYVLTQNFAFTISRCKRQSEHLETLEPLHFWPSSSGRNLRSRSKTIDAGARCNEQALRDEMPNTAVHACRQSKTKKKEIRRSPRLARLAAGKAGPFLDASSRHPGTERHDCFASLGHGERYLGRLVRCEEDIVSEQSQEKGKSRKGQGAIRRSRGKSIEGNSKSRTLHSSPWP